MAPFASFKPGLGEGTRTMAVLLLRPDETSYGSAEIEQEKSSNLGCMT